MIFIDTGAFLARHHGADQHHEAAIAGWRDLESRASLRCFTSNHVLDETVTLLGRRAGHPFAAARARSILASAVLTILRPAAAEELEAVELFEKFGDQGVSFTDCTSFALMRRHRIPNAFAFDRHFEAAGFTLWPGGPGQS